MKPNVAKSSVCKICVVKFKTPWHLRRHEHNMHTSRKQRVSDEVSYDMTGDERISFDDSDDDDNQKIIGDAIGNLLNFLTEKVNESPTKEYDVKPDF